MKSSRLVKRHKGFTLVELIVVMSVLAVLSGLVLPKLDVFKLKANKSSAAANMAGVDRFLVAYKVEHDLFPDGFDSLMDSTGTTLFTRLEPQLLGSTPGSPHKLTTTTITDDNELRSLQRVGLANVYDHVTGGFPGDSGQTQRALATGATVATVNTADSDGQGILRHFYPQTNGTPPSGTKVVIFGAGPHNQLNGTLLHSMPFYANTDQLSYYNRFLAVFELKSSGSRARFLGTLGADGDTISEEIQDYYEN